MIYVDNCSTDGSIEFIRQHYPQVTIIQNQEALGFGENNNKGVLAAHGEYIAVINPDIIIKGDALCHMLTFAQKHPEVGIIVPQLLNPDGSKNNTLERVIILAPSHRTFINGISFPEYNTYKTALGEIKVDTEAIKILSKAPSFLVSKEAHDKEHAIEIQLPFLQHVLINF